LRETLFNILGDRVTGARVLDGYAGTGAIGIEALSRGAAHVTFIEDDGRATALISENLRTCGIGERYTINRNDLIAALEGTSDLFDLMLLDPPYETAEVRRALEASGRRLAPDGVLVLERATRRQPDVPSALVRVRDVRSGDSTLTFLRHGVGSPPLGKAEDPKGRDRTQ
jgi:16S rRNA (guanine966-N2)-methyltransferase